MREQFLKQCVKRLLALSFVVFVFAGCEQNEEHSHEANGTSVVVAEKDFDELFAKDKFRTAIQKLPKTKNSINTGTEGRTAMEDDYGFTISDKPVKIIETDTVTSYTMLINRYTVKEGSFENLVISVKAGTQETRAHILEYILSSDITRTEDGSVKFTTSDVKVTPILEASKSSTVCMTISTLMCHYGGTDHQAGANCTQTFWQTSTRCWTMSGGGSGGSGSSSGSGGSGGSGGGAGGAGGGGGTGGAGDYSGNNGNGDGSGDTGSGTDPNAGNEGDEHGPQEVTPIITAPVVDDEDEDTPCQKMTLLKNDAVFKQKMMTLKTAATQWSFEKTYTIYDDTTPNDPPSQSDNFDYSEFQGTSFNPSAQYSYYPNIKGVIHSHYNGLLSVFSPTDLVDLYNLLNNPQITEDLFYGVVTKSGTAYILQIGDRDAFLAFGLKYLSTQSKFYDFETRKFSKYNIKPSNSNIANEEGFMEMLTDLNLGLNVYKANSDFSNYEKLTYNNNSGVVPAPCN
ncbi:MAG TPA: hypothetical protein VF676_02615 [Flavobacterium sp.]|jgi:hypothetical protein